jgi:cytochrome c-type biogenesis protein CcmE
MIADLKTWQPRHTRLLIVLAVLIGVGGAVALTLMGLRQKVTYFYSPSDVAAHEAELLAETKNIRLGGLVEKGSLKHVGDGLSISFTVTDGEKSIQVLYHGLTPDLFREGRGVVAEGYLKARHEFAAHTLLAKHDENYMPPEVAKTLKRP